MDTFLMSACRTPIGAFGGALRDLSASDLGAIVIREAIGRTGGVKPADIGDVILGCVQQAGAGMNVARQASLKAGLPVEVPQKKGAPLRVDRDEYPRLDTTLEKLASLRSAFTKEGTVTAGNASGINEAVRGSSPPLVYALHDRGARYGAASLCVGGGMGTAMIVERV